MNVFRRKNGTDIVQHIFQKVKSLLVAGAVDFFENTPLRSDFYRSSSAAQLWVGRDHCLAVPGQFNLRNHFDTQTTCVGHDLFQIFTAVRTAVNAIAKRAVGRHFCKFRVRIHRNAPPLIFGEVPVQDVKFIQRHDIELAFDLSHGEKVTADVEQYPAVGKGRRILNLSPWQDGLVAQHVELI
ncbi:MAG: Uncharacterised protein [Cryomorphaceae bacterium]|nr:MAG: Uncharacterised protein [Cryomorphaceae bacterium]